MIKGILQELQHFIGKISDNELEENKDSLTDFSSKKKAYYVSLYNAKVADFLMQLRNVQNAENSKVVIEMMPLAEELAQEKNRERITDLLASLIDFERKLVYKKEEKGLSFKIPKVSAEIYDEMRLDVKELEKCFNTGCFRAAIILCGRLLETALHRKYFEATDQDLLEKAPGIGLGNLIAKMKDKGIPLEPALSQQIHLINQVRIYSVHTKKQSFNPTKEQTHAIILYTLEAIRKLF
ncbi:DUF4145 domain-containing protein [Candidatus Woesearchaeota archaeon]|nr:DUF4145 domain-containing protein [Candidatus Woesearchaeota archaeon]